MSITANEPIKSPSLNEYDLPTMETDEGIILPVIGVVVPNSASETGLDPDIITDVPVSQVTGKRQWPLAGEGKLPIAALVGVDPATGAPLPFVAGSAATADFATEAGHATSADTADAAGTITTGKFQSTVQTGTGSSQDIAHGMGVVPTLVLVSIYDTNGVALPHAISEGAHDSTNLKVSVTASVKYKVIAFA